MRHGPCDAFDVRGERCIVLQVIGRVLAHEIDDARTRFLRVVKVREAIAETRPEVEQRARGLAAQAVVTVRGAGNDAFEHAEHAAHALDFVQCGDEVHFGRARIGEADVDAVHDQCTHETFRAVHSSSFCERHIMLSLGS
jgi:hypothetical protein